MLLCFRSRSQRLATLLFILLYGILETGSAEPPTSIQGLYKGATNDVILKGGVLDELNTVLVASDSACNSSTQTLTAGVIVQQDPTAVPIVDEVLVFEKVSNLPDTGFLCWCPDSTHPCPEGASFPFTLEGPDGGVTKSTTVGILFTVTVEGTGLSPDDRLLFTTTACGDPRSEKTFFQDEKPSMYVEQKFVAYVATKDPLFICWCPGVRGCQDDSMFLSPVGTVSAVGPHFGLQIDIKVGQEFSIVLPTAIASDGDFIRVTKAGECGPNNDEAVVNMICDRLNNCESVNTGIPDAFDAISETWHRFSLEQPGTYSICWCQDSTFDPLTFDTITAACGALTKSAFSVEVGTITVTGITPGSYECDAWEDCLIEYGSPQDGILTLDIGKDCSDSRYVQDDELIQFIGTGFTLPHMSPSSQKLCYCEFAMTGYCDHPSAYKQVLGYLMVKGERTVPGGSFNCDAAECHVKILDIRMVLSRL